MNVTRPEVYTIAPVRAPGVFDLRMPVHALIFDLDGTLADSLTDIAEAMNSALAQHSLPPHPVDAYRLMVGNGVTMLATRAIGPKASDPALLLSVLDAHHAAYQAHAHAKTWPYPGIDAMLATLVERKVPMGVLSNKRDALTAGLVAQRFGSVPFLAVRGERDGVPRKPDPTAAFEMALALNVLPANIGFVGDTSVDMKTARAAGMKAIGVLWGFRGREEIEGAGAHHILSKPDELLALIG